MCHVCNTAHRTVRNSMRLDPTRTTLIRRAVIVELNKRFRLLRRDVMKLVEEDDIFGLKQKTDPIKQALATNAPRRAWEFKTVDAKLTSFNRWFKRQVQLRVLDGGSSKRPWLADYVESAYKKGALRAYTDTHKELNRPQAYYDGSRAEFLRQAFGSPEATAKIRMAYMRAYEELQGITAAMSQQISRVMADSISHGRGAAETARMLNKRISGIGRQRALVLARTEIVHAHAEGQLDSFEHLGVEELGVEAEWKTAGDDAVCEECADLEGRIYTVEEARGMIPRHPNCRCAWIPYLGPTNNQARREFLARRRSRRFMRISASPVRTSAW